MTFKTINLEDDQKIKSVLEKTEPSVVSIIGRAKDYNNYAYFLPHGVEQAIGSGFVVKENLVVTNNHVVLDSSKDYYLLTFEKKYIKVTKIYNEPKLDLALLEADISGLKPLILVPYSLVNKGERVFAIGNTNGELPYSITTGIISTKGRIVDFSNNYDQYKIYNNLIQSDVNLYPGFSGGPMINLNGEVVGINVLRDKNSVTGLTLPTDNLSALLLNYKKYQKINKAYLGFTYQIGQIYLNNTNPPQSIDGIFIKGIIPNSPASKTILKPDDFIYAYNNTQLSKTYTIEDALLSTFPGDKVTLSVYISPGQNNIQDIEIITGSKSE